MSNAREVRIELEARKTNQTLQGEGICRIEVVFSPTTEANLVQDIENSVDKMVNKLKTKIQHAANHMSTV